MTPTTTGMPTHKDLPDSDGSIVENCQESPQSALLAECLLPRLRQVRPDGQFLIGTDNGIYWRLTDPVLDGCKSPDFFIVLGVPPMLDGEVRRSYVLWQEKVPPLIAIEYVSGSGAEERDRTPGRGKMWVYEQGIVIPYYVIFDGFRDTLAAFQLRGGVYVSMEPNAEGRYVVPELGVEFGMWAGTVRDLPGTWLRAYDCATRAMLPSDAEAAEAARQRAEAAEGLIDDWRHEAEEQAEQARQERQRADEAVRSADDERQRREAAEQQIAALMEQLRRLTPPG